MVRRKNGASLLQTKDERNGECLPLARTLLLATPSSRGSIAAPATPRFMHMQFFMKKTTLVFSGSPSIVYRLSSFV